MIKMPASSVPDESSLPVLQMVAFSLYPHMVEREKGREREREKDLFLFLLRPQSFQIRAPPF